MAHLEQQSAAEGQGRATTRVLVARPPCGGDDGLDAEQIATHALREDLSTLVAQLLVLGASVASLVGVGYLLVRASTKTGADQGFAAALGVISVAVCWLAVHTLRRDRESCGESGRRNGWW